MRTAEKEAIRKAAFKLVRHAYDDLSNAVNSQAQIVYAFSPDADDLRERLSTTVIAVRPMLRAAGFSAGEIDDLIDEAERIKE